MRKLFLSVVVIGLIAAPAAFAHGHLRGHATDHSRQRHHSQHTLTSARNMQARELAAAGRNTRYVDEEELAVDELANKAVDTRLTDTKAN